VTAVALGRRQPTPTGARQVGHGTSNAGSLGHSCPQWWQRTLMRHPSPPPRVTRRTDFPSRASCSLQGVSFEWIREGEDGFRPLLLPEDSEASLYEPGFTVEPHRVAANPDQAWVADITYVPTREGWLYLAIVLDLASRLVVGWSMGETLEASLAVDALEMALQRRRPGEGLLHHSDRGVQYASNEYRALLEGREAVVSMSRKGNCWDNAVAESFFATMEIELIQDEDWHTRNEARRAIFEFIEVWYNRQRRHSSLEY
jgi:putative transposase